MEKYVFVANGYELDSFETEDIDMEDIFDYIEDHEAFIASLDDIVEVYFRDVYGNCFQSYTLYKDEDGNLAVQ